MPSVHPITLNQAATMISNFLNDRYLGPIAENIAIGGLIDLDVSKENVDGWTFWYCWNPDDNNFPKFFTAYEQNVWTEESPDDMSVLSDNLLMPYPGYIFTYDSSSGTSIEAVIGFITNQRKEWGTTKTSDPEINYQDVEVFASNFMDPFPENNPNPYCGFPIAFFDGAEIADFVEQGDYVRYYFGLDTSYGVNKIRLILFSVASNGTNQVGNGAVMMQHSWPPDA